MFILFFYADFYVPHHSKHSLLLGPLPCLTKLSPNRLNVFDGVNTWWQRWHDCFTYMIVNESFCYRTNRKCTTAHHIFCSYCAISIPAYFEVLWTPCQVICVCLAVWSNTLNSLLCTHVLISFSVTVLLTIYTLLGFSNVTVFNMLMWHFCYRPAAFFFVEGGPVPPASVIIIVLIYGTVVCFPNFLFSIHGVCWIPFHLIV